MGWDKLSGGGAGVEKEKRLKRWQLPKVMPRSTSWGPSTAASGSAP